MASRFCTWAIVAFAASGLARATHAQFLYTTLDYPNANLTNVYGLNDAGHVVGEYEDSYGEYHAFVWRRGDFESFDVPGTLGCTAFDINSAGQIVGIYGIHGAYMGQSGILTQAFLLDDGVFTDIVPLVGSRFIQARSINDLGTIVGEYVNFNEVDRGFIYDGASYTTFNRTGATGTVALQHNNTGVIVGSFYTGNQLRGFRSSGGTYTTLSYPGAVTTIAAGVTDAGRIVGFYQDLSGVEHGFEWNSGVFATIDLPGANSTRVTSINNNGQIVGSFEDALGTHGFLMTPAAAADFDVDGSVDGDDLVAWTSHAGLATGATHAQGDADKDADVDGSDLLVWQRQLGGGVPAAVAVPEPAALALSAASLLIFSKRPCRGQAGPTSLNHDGELSPTPGADSNPREGEAPT